MLSPKTRISHRLFVVLLFIAVLPLGVLGYGAAHLAEKILVKTAFMHMSTIAEDHANHLDIWLRERLADLKLLSKLPSIRMACNRCPIIHKKQGEQAGADQNDQLRDMLSIIQSSTPDYEAIHILSANGSLIGSTISHLPHGSGFKPALIIQLMENQRQPVLGQPYTVDDGSWYVQLVAPIDGSKGNFAGYIVVDIDLSKTLDPLMSDRAGLGESGETFVISEEGHMLTRSRHVSKQDWLHSKFDSSGIRAALKHYSGASIYTNYRGHQVVGAYRWLPRYGWAILAEMDKAEILAPVRWLKAAVFFSVAAVGLLCLSVAWLVARKVSQPIVRIAEATESIAEGQLDQQITVPVSGQDEIARLAASFNTMSQKLSSTIETLRKNEAYLRKAYHQRKELEDQLIQSEKMAAIGELVANVVHEMRNTLSSIKLNLQILGRAVGPQDQLTEHFKIALSQVKLLETMFEDLLDFSKPISIEKRLSSLPQLVETSLAQLRGDIKTNGVEVLNKLPDNLPDIFVDPEKSVQVIVNVLKNAIQASLPQGKIVIEAETIIQADGSGLNVCLVITDSGPGISPKHLQRLYQPFFTTRKKGTGLGLSIVKKIMDAHGGKVTINSNLGVGTTVRLYFKAA